MAATFVVLLLLLSICHTVEARAFGGTDVARINSTIDDAKAKFSSAHYVYLDDPSPGDYFDSILSGAKLLIAAMNEIEPRVADTMRKLGRKEYTIRWFIPYADFYNHLLGSCKTFDIDSVLKMTNQLMGEQCDQGLGEDGSMEQDLQRRMVQFAKENAFEGGNENMCLHLFIARFTRSSQAVRILKSAVDKYLLATTTVHAFCTVIQRTPNEADNRARVVQAQAMLAKSLARIQLNDTASWTCENAQSIQAEIDAQMTGLHVASLSEIIDKANGKVSSSDYFFNDSSAADYFDSLSTAAGSLAIAQKATKTDSMVKKWKVVKEAFSSLFRDISLITDEQAVPFGLNECGLLPAELSDNGVVPIISSSLNAMRATLSDYDDMVKACKLSNVDVIMKTLRDLAGNGCKEGVGQNGTTEAGMQETMMRFAEAHRFEGGNENKCLHLFIARYTGSEAAVQMFKRSFDKYLLATVTMQAICTAFTARCDEEAYRTQVIEAHASFAASLVRTMSVQLNNTTPPKCDDSQQVIIANMKKACERVKSTAASDTYFLGERMEEFENKTYDMADALTNLHEEVFQSARDTKRPRKAEAFKRTLPAVLEQLVDLMIHLKGVRSELSISFGEKDDGLLPQDAVCDDKTFPIYQLLRKVAEALNWLRNNLNDGGYRVLYVCVGSSTIDYHKMNDEMLKEVNVLVAPRCLNDSVGNYDEEKMRDNMLRYATKHGFEGCEDNK